MRGNPALTTSAFLRNGRTAALAMVAGLTLIAMPAEAQDVGADDSSLSSSTSGAGCTINQALTDAGPQVLFADCHGRTLVLGPATDYRVFRNDSLEATIVDMRDGDERRILLLSSSRDGQPALKNIGGAIMFEGASEPVAVADLDIDFSEFAADGSVFIRSPVAGQSSSADPAVIRIGDHIARARAGTGGIGPDD